MYLTYLTDACTSLGDAYIEHDATFATTKEKLMLFCYSKCPNKHQSSPW